MYLSKDFGEALEGVVLSKHLARSVSLPPPAERRATRVNAGLTQSDLADCLMVHPDTFSRWERGDQEPGPMSRQAYADVLAALDDIVARHDLTNNRGSR
jgi:DNA-binding transcriptional regulator YiaG